MHRTKILTPEQTIHLLKTSFSDAFTKEPQFLREMSKDLVTGIVDPSKSRGRGTNKFQNVITDVFLPSWKHLPSRRNAVYMHHSNKSLQYITSYYAVPKNGANMAHAISPDIWNDLDGFATLQKFPTWVGKYLIESLGGVRVEKTPEMYKLEEEVVNAHDKLFTVCSADEYTPATVKNIISLTDDMISAFLKYVKISGASVEVDYPMGIEMVFVRTVIEKINKTGKTPNLFGLINTHYKPQKHGIHQFKVFSKTPPYRAEVWTDSPCILIRASGRPTDFGVYDGLYNQIHGKQPQ